MYTHANAAATRASRPSALPVVIVADDDPLFRDLLCECVRACGAQAVSAVDAMQTVMYAMQRAPAAILLDINMPGGTGVGALRRLRQSTRTMQIPIVVVTGTTDAAVEREVRQLGVRHILHKPVEPGLLQAALEEAMAGERTVR
jgi:CheY-like chemotaxis protein